MTSRTELFARQLVRRRYLLLTAAIVLTVLAVPWSRRLSFEQSIVSLYAQDDPYLVNFLESKSLFGGDEFVIVVWTEADLFEDDDVTLTATAEQRIRDFASALSAVPGVNADSTQALPEALKTRMVRRRVRRMAIRTLIGDDARTTAIILRLLDEAETATPRKDTIAEIRRQAAAHEPPAAVVGEPVQISDMFHIVENDGHVLFIASLVVLAVVLFVLLGNLRWVVIAIAIVSVTIIWTRALLVIMEIRLSMVSSLLNSMINIIGIATVTHLAIHYRELRRTSEPEAAMVGTLRDLLPPVLWTSLTTAVGFAALLASQVTPIRSLGLMIALGALLIIVAVVMILPGSVLIMNRGRAGRDAPAEQHLSRMLNSTSSGIERRPLLLAIVAATLFFGTLPGLWKLKLETNFIRNFRDSTPIVQSLSFVETNLGGAGTWEVNFPAPIELTDEFLDRVRRATDRLRDVQDESGQPRLTVTSVTDGVDMVPKLPLFSNTLEKRIGFLRRFQPEFMPSIFNADAGRMRILLRAYEQQQSDTKLDLIATAQRIVNEELQLAGAPNTIDSATSSIVDDIASTEALATENSVPAGQAKATGIFVLLAFIIQSLLGDQLVSFTWASVGICCMMMIAFRSLKIGVLSLIPNVFPIVVVIGGMGWIGTPVNIGTAMIASISMGLTVDSTIHYISAFRRARVTHSVAESLRHTHQGVGRSLVFAHFALVAGFLVLTVSDFVPLIYLGVLLSLSMIGGLFGDLIVLPLILHWTENDDPVTTRDAT